MKKLLTLCLICLTVPAYATATLMIKKNPEPAPQVKPVAPVNPVVYPPRPIHPPYVIYSYERVNSNSNSNSTAQPVQVINNTYNYYENSAAENTAAASSKTKEQLEEEERQYLKEKYSDILRNKTMSNEQMCKKMAACFTGADYNELDRVLNKILLLNCDINKLR